MATLSFGKVAHLSFIEPLSRFMLWVAVAARTEAMAQVRKLGLIAWTAWGPGRRMLA